MAEQVEVVGADRLATTLHQLGRKLPTVAPESAAQIIGREAVMRVPKRSGRLAGSFSGTSSSGQVAVRFGTAYAAPIQWGVGARAGLRGPHNIRRSNFLFGAIESTQQQWLGEYTEQVEILLSEVKGA